MPNRSRKRNRSCSEDRSVLKLLKRMDKRIKLLETKNTGRRRIIVATSSSSSDDRSDSEQERFVHNSSRSSGDESRGSVRRDQGLVPNIEEGPITQIGEDADNNLPQPLDKGLLAILGEEVDREIVLGEPLQPEIAERWLHIAKTGLDESVLKQIMEKYPPPKNGTLLGPPQLNLMVKQAIHNSVERRDERLSKIQSRLAASLSAIGQVMSKILERKGGGEGDVKGYIENLNDAGRIIIDVIHSESMSRRELVTYDLNKDWKTTLIESPLDKWLFGEDLEGRLKTAKELQVSSRQLKTLKNTPRKDTSNTSRSGSLPNLNFRSLPQHQQGVKQGRRNTREAPHNRQRQGRPWDRNHYFAMKSQDKERGNKKFRRQ